MNCPLCGFRDAYVGFTTIECGNIECTKYVKPKEELDETEKKPEYFIHSDEAILSSWTDINEKEQTHSTVLSDYQKQLLDIYSVPDGSIFISLQSLAEAFGIEYPQEEKLESLESV